MFDILLLKPDLYFQLLGNILKYTVFVFFFFEDSGNYSSALRCYLEAGAVASSFFYLPVPSTVWDDQVNNFSSIL